MPRTILSTGLPNKSYRHGSVKVEFMGDWHKLSSLVNNSDFMITQAAIQGQLDFANQYKRELKKNIMNGGAKFGYPPLSTKYQKKKKRYAKSSKKFIFTYSLYHAIAVITKKLKYISVGVPKGLYKKEHAHISNNIPIDEYAMVLESGSANVPKRPIFQDTYNDIGGTTLLVKKITAQLIRVHTLFKITP